MLKVVTFDFWNTLFVDHSGKLRKDMRATFLREELAAVGIARSSPALYDGLSAGYRYFDDIWHNEMRTPRLAEILEAVFSDLGVSPPQETKDRIADAFEALIIELPPDLVPGASETLRELSQRFTLAIVCDTAYTPGRTLRKLLDREGLTECFDHFCFSDEMGMSKPDPRIFRAVLEKSGARGPDAAHVGDMERTDIAGAHAAGMWALLFCGANSHDAASTTADAIVERFVDLPTALGALMCPGC